MKSRRREEEVKRNNGEKHLGDHGGSESLGNQKPGDRGCREIEKGQEEVKGKAGARAGRRRVWSGGDKAKSPLSIWLRVRV